MKYLASFILVLCLVSSASADAYKFVTKTFSTYGWGMADTNELDAAKQKVFNDFAKEGEVINIQETPHTVDGTVTMYTYTAKIRVK